jgi:GalNAc-alpha-(1->4)-GalNAc-alpha-(1->3)-diNAcBac-PP-undecaprenol alpha-1,4-N-acetyl-D-galactosaminyltransferase
VLRTTLVVSSMRGGGAERVVSRLANYWAEKGWPTTVLTVAQGAEPPSYSLHPRVTYQDMGFRKQARHPIPSADVLHALKKTFERASAPERRTLLANLHLIVALKQAVQRTRPDLVISFIDVTNVRVLLAVQALGVPVIVSERSDPRRTALGDGMRRLRRRLYPRAAWLVAQTDEMASYFAHDMGQRVRVIPNPVVRPSSTAACVGTVKEQDAAHLLVGMGRLADEKGFTLLVRAFAQLAAKHPSWSLEIWGIGPLKAVLQQLAHRLGLDGRVKLPGFTSRPADVFARADLFALSSISEGFPNVLCEAMASGLPVVSFDCSSGVRQIIRSGVDGAIVDTISIGSLAAALDRLMSSREDRARLSARAVEVTSRFGIEKVMAQWESLAYASVGRQPAAREQAPRGLAVPSTGGVTPQPAAIDTHPRAVT